MTDTVPSKPPNILIVDDTPADVLLFERILTASGYQVRPVLSGKLALQAARTEPPDLILLDINMPEMNGYELCAQLKADAALQNIPVMFISALNEPEEKLKAFRLGGVDFVTKPFHLEEVKARVETHLRIRSLQRQLDRKNENLEQLVAEIQGAREFAKNIVEALDGQMYICTHDYRISFMNQRLIERTGRNAVGEPCYRALHDLDAVCPWCVNDRVFKGEVVRWEVQIPKDRLWYDVINTPVHNADGTVSKMAIINDISERKLIEIKLIESELHLQTIIENEPECIKIMDKEGLLLQMNPAGLAMIEADSLEQVVGRPVLELIAPEYRTTYAELHQRVLAGETMVMQYEILGLKGGRRWLETHAVPMPNQGMVVHLAVTRDITEQKKSGTGSSENQSPAQRSTNSGRICQPGQKCFSGQHEP